MLIALVGQGYLRGLSDTVTPFRVVIVANVLNVVLEVVLVYGFHLGVAGSAWGTVVAQWLAAAWFVGCLDGGGVFPQNGYPPPPPQEAPLIWNRPNPSSPPPPPMATPPAPPPSPPPAAPPPRPVIRCLADRDVPGPRRQTPALPLLGRGGPALGARDVDDAWATSNRLLQFGIWIGVGLAVIVAGLSPVLPHAFTADGSVVSRATIGLVLVGVIQIHRRWPSFSTAR